MRKTLYMALFLFIFMGGVAESAEISGHPVTTSDRCAVCGMMVAKYPAWLTQIELEDGTMLMFDGVKDMMVFYFSPERYGKASDLSKSKMIVKDYYSQKWFDAFTGYYVVGSDVHGPMGHEFVPFESKEAAENFMLDHKGKEILTFQQIDLERVEAMRGGHKMNMKQMDKKSE